MLIICSYMFGFHMLGISSKSKVCKGVCKMYSLVKEHSWSWPIYATLPAILQDGSQWASPCCSWLVLCLRFVLQQLLPNVPWLTYVGVHQNNQHPLKHQIPWIICLPLAGFWIRCHIRGEAQYQGCPRKLFCINYIGIYLQGGKEFPTNHLPIHLPIHPKQSIY